MIYNTIKGNKKNNKIEGDNNPSNLNDEIKGFAGDDRLFGLTGDNLLYGGDGNDSLSVDSVNGSIATGDIIFDGGTGNDILNLDSNSDRTGTLKIEFANGDGFDRIIDFRAGNSDDIIVFTNIPFIDLITVGTATEIRLGDGTTGNDGFGTGDLLMTLDNVVATDLTVDNFQNTDFFLS